MPLKKNFNFPSPETSFSFYFFSPSLWARNLVNAFKHNKRKKREKRRLAVTLIPRLSAENDQLLFGKHVFQGVKN